MTMIELAIPGFIKFAINADFTIGRELAKGGGGTIHLGACISKEAAYRAESRELIVKRIGLCTVEMKEGDSFCSYCFRQR